MILAVIRRLLRLVVILFAASVLVFAAVLVAPGSPLATLSGGRSLTAEQTAALIAHYHLDEPVPAQYWRWLTGVLQGDLGDSIVSQVSVADLIGSRIGTTALLVLYAAVLITVFALVLGAVAALKGGALDSAIVALTGAAAAIPSFVAAAALVSVFAVNLGWFPALGDGSGGGLAAALWHLTLPAIALSLAGIGLCARLTRTSVLEQSVLEHVGVARVRGIPEQRVVRRHVLRNAALPVTTALGLTIAGLAAGAVVVEQAFGLNGIGSLLVQSISSKDFPVIQGVTLLLVATFVVVNTLVDLLYPVLDPRLRTRGLA